ncbi:MAG: hypothetical protein BEN18_04220 [Epulopiscium sp. Nuni2H_MBin001]|nr:MAG: hypothetical protein BEN18_04220 [Epulopiscium sp. Nuni2H_MBin001]
MHNKGWGTPIILFITFTILLLQYTSEANIPSITTSATVQQVCDDGIPSVVTRLAFNYEDFEVEIILDNNDWVMANGDAADSAYIFNLLSMFAAAPLDVVSDDPSLYTYGVNSRSKTLTLSDADGATFTLMQGSVASDTHYYAFHVENHCIYTIDKACFDALSADLNVWRTKDIVVFDEIIKVDVSFGDASSHSIYISGDDFMSPTLSEDVYLDIIKFLANNKVLSFVTNQASAELLSMYNLDSPLVSFSIFYSDSDFVVLHLVPNPFNALELYGTIDGSNDIFIMPVIN